MSKPHKLYVWHPFGQGKKIKYAFAFDEVPNADHHHIGFGETKPFSEDCSFFLAWVKMSGINSVGEDNNRFGHSVLFQESLGIRGWGDDHIPLLVEKSYPATEQWGQGIRKGEGMFEILHGGMCIPDNVYPSSLCLPYCKHAVREDCIDMDDR